MTDLLVKDVLLPDGSGRMDVGISSGRIAFIAPSSEGGREAAEIVNGKGGLLLPGFVEPHIHLEKAYLLARMDRETESLQDAIQMTAQMKNTFTAKDITERSLAVIREASRHGVTHMRCHAEVDPILGLSAIESALELKQSVSRQMDLQVVAFPQEGIFKCPGTAELMEEAMRLGADVVGGITYQDHDLGGHLDFTFSLAEKYGKPLDYHADFSDNPSDRAIVDIARRTIAAGMQGLVSAGHVTSLGSMPVIEACSIGELLHDAQIHVITLPLTDLYLNGRGDGEKPRRGLAPVRLLRECGVNVTLGTNNVRNPFTPFGKADPLEVAWLLAIATYMGGGQDAHSLMNMLTVDSAKALGLDSYGIHVGSPADMVLFRESSVREVLLNRPEIRTVWKRGKQVAHTRMKQQLL
ncbi:amidohydrolase family protein [Paenibacillus sp. FSL R7-0345]|uniref:amidohydrolase family protein n=1 Tax=Paenibacillus sp. FSL R7-0345 TaxID=2954535 RepID=UPI00315B3F10